MATDSPQTGPFTLVLGSAQDGGFPQAGCLRPCCTEAWADPQRKRHVACLAIVDAESQQRWIIDCTPDLPEQLNMLNQLAPAPDQPAINAVLLTHAHIGHYTGLVHFGREVTDARHLSVYAMPQMEQFLLRNAPWCRLVEQGNIKLRSLAAGQSVELGHCVKVTPILVPHRNEGSETVAFRVMGRLRSVLYLPDIDGWDQCETPIEDMLAEVDVAYLDGTFFASDELPHRDLSAIPHPLIVDSIRRWQGLPGDLRAKVRFIHLNHTNPALHPASEAAQRIHSAGHQVAREGEKISI